MFCIREQTIMSEIRGAFYIVLQLHFGEASMEFLKTALENFISFYHSLILTIVIEVEN